MEMVYTRYSGADPGFSEGGVSRPQRPPPGSAPGISPALFLSTNTLLLMEILKAQYCICMQTVVLTHRNFHNISI